MAARQIVNGRREPWENVAYACVRVAIEALEMAGFRDPTAISDALADYADMTFDVEIRPLADADPPPLAEDGSRNLGSETELQDGSPGSAITVER